MSDELLPCPFCGGEAEFETYGGTACAVTCRKCRCGTPTVSLNDGERAVEVWNRRAERTCRMTFDDVSSSLYSGPMLKCSKCGACVPREFSGPYNYCPNCGARVVGE